MYLTQRSVYVLWLYEVLSMFLLNTSLLKIVSSCNNVWIYDSFTLLLQYFYYDFCDYVVSRTDVYEVVNRNDPTNKPSGMFPWRYIIFKSQVQNRLICSKMRR